MLTQPKLSPDVTKAIGGYADKVMELLREAVECQRSDHDRFLWTARRALEATCLMLLCLHGRAVVTARDKDPKKREPRGLESLILQLRTDHNAISETRLSTFDTLRSNVNQGVHVRTWEADDLAELVSQSKDALANLVHWAVTESGVQHHYDIPADLKTLLRDLRQGGSYPPPDPVPELRDRLAKAEQARNELVADLARATLRLQAVGDAATAAAARQPKPPDTRPSRARGAVIGLAGAGFAAIALGAWTQGPTVPAFVAACSAEPSAPPLAEPAPPPPPPPCPDGFKLIPAGTVQLGQPIGGRKDWPSAVPTVIPPLYVPAFCVMTGPVTWAQLGPLRDLPDVRSCRAKRPQDTTDDRPAGCLNRDEAEGHCSNLFPGSRLPTIAEWEHLWRVDGAFRTRGIPREWVADRFPPAVLNRRGPESGKNWMFLEKLDNAPPDPSAAVMWSWNRRESNDRNWNDGFRCAMKPR